MHPIQYISTMHSKARFLYVFRSSDYMAIHVAPNNCIFRDMHLKLGSCMCLDLATTWQSMLHRTTVFLETCIQKLGSCTCLDLATTWQSMLHRTTVFSETCIKARFLYVFRSSDYMAIHVAPNNCVFRDMHSVAVPLLFAGI